MIILKEEKDTPNTISKSEYSHCLVCVCKL